LFHSLARQKECTILEGHLQPDHIHILISIPPKYSVAQVFILFIFSRVDLIVYSGVFYAAETLKTAAAEVGYWRWRFLQDSAGLERLQPSVFTAFAVPISTDCIDVREPPYDADAVNVDASGR
jgi:REP element-mobilizing transposase RayT